MTAPFIPLAPGRAVGWRVDPTTGCWRWSAWFKHHPVATIGGRCRSVVRWLWEQPTAFGGGVPQPLPAGVRLRRTCATKGCVNPAHHVPLYRTKLADAARAIAERTCPTCGRPWRPPEEAKR